MTGQVATGAVISFVASTEKLSPVALVNEKVRFPPANVTPVKRE